MSESLKVNMGELKIGFNDDMLVAFGIGSCVVVVCYEKSLRIAAMLHGMLPEKPHKSKKVLQDNRYLDTGIENLIKELIKHDAKVQNMEAKIFGGAKMFEIASETVPIGEKNVLAAKAALEKKQIPIVASDTGETYGRTIEFYVSDKKAYVKSFGHETKTY